MECDDMGCWPMRRLAISTVVVTQNRLYMHRAARGLHEHVVQGAEPWISSALLVCLSINKGKLEQLWKMFVIYV
jgi:hypothetical protein